MIWDMSIDSGATTLALWTRSRGAYVWPLPSAPFRTCADFNGDGTVNVLDIATEAEHWLETPGLAWLEQPLRPRWRRRCGHRRHHAGDAGVWQQLLALLDWTFLVKGPV